MLTVLRVLIYKLTKMLYNIYKVQFYWEAILWINFPERNFFSAKKAWKS